MSRRKYLTLKEIQNEELKILKESIEFFNKHNIAYYIWAGTFLGAVRHKGFIPWDDDIDLVIPRPEYNRFVEYLKSHDNKISDNFDVIGYELGNYDLPFLKIINKKIKLESKKTCDEYLWIDIFPLDASPKNNKKFYDKIEIYKKILVFKQQQNRGIKLYSSNKLKGFIKKIIMGLLKIWKYDKFLKFYCNYCTKYNYDDYEYVHNNVFSSGSVILYNKKEFKNKTFYFDGLEVNGIYNYDKILTKWYGNYMELPPENERVNHNFKAWKVK